MATGASREPIKVGLLGAGYIADAHARALAAIPGVRLHAVGDLSASRAAALAARYKAPHVLHSIEQMAASDCDVVHVLLPPHMHTDAARALVEAGKSVLLEKPMGLDSAACAALQVQAAQQRVVVAVSHNFLFSRGYEWLRERVAAGDLGRIDHVSVNWHFALPLLQFGPFDSWVLAAPANLLFELGPHLAAFVLDLVGMPAVTTASAANPIELPGDQTVYRHWNVFGRTDYAAVSVSISVTAGHSDRILRVRGRGASAQLDFGRDIVWLDATTSDNPIFDSHATAAAAGSMLRRQARIDRRRRLKAALAIRPDANPFEESIFRSLRTFYANGLQQLDPRHDARLGIDVMRLCETIALSARVGRPSTGGVARAAATAATDSVGAQKARRPDVLVVGGTGFIGCRLVRRLVEAGHSVRILTRNVRAAAMQFDGLDVQVMAGSHGDADCARRAVEGVSVVYHLAKCEGKRWQDYLDGDVEPTRVLARAAAAAAVRRFIYTGTIASYASGNPRDVIDNRTPLDPAILRRGLYARSKAACEQVLQAVRRERGLPLVILRPGIVIGPGSPPAHPGVARFTSETRAQFWGDGKNALPLVLVDDVADALLRAMQAPDIDGQALLVTGPPLLSARDYVGELAHYAGARVDCRQRSAWRHWAAELIKELAKNAVRHPNRRWPSLHDWRCSAQLARFDSRMTEQALGWSPVADRETLIARGIADTVTWQLR